MSRRKTYKELKAAIKKGDIETVKNKLDGFDVNFMPFTGSPLLVYAIEAKQDDIGELLVQKGADVNAEGWASDCPIMNAIESKLPKTVEAICQDPNLEAKGMMVIPNTGSASVTVLRTEKNDALIDLAQKTGHPQIIESVYNQRIRSLERKAEEIKENAWICPNKRSAKVSQQAQALKQVRNRNLKQFKP